MIWLWLRIIKDYDNSFLPEGRRGPNKRRNCLIKQLCVRCSIVQSWEEDRERIKSTHSVLTSAMRSFDPWRRCLHKCIHNKLQNKWMLFFSSGLFSFWSPGPNLANISSCYCLLGAPFVDHIMRSYTRTNPFHLRLFWQREHFSWTKGSFLLLLLCCRSTSHTFPYRRTTGWRIGIGSVR